MEALEVMCCVLLCMLEYVEGELWFLEALKVMRCMLEAVEGIFCLLEVLEVLEGPKVMHRVLLCMLEAVEGGLCLPEVIAVCCSVCWRR